jgi:hypothetical protein
MIYAISLQSISDDKTREKELITQEQQHGQSPIYSFMYALKSTEARRQYPKRLKMFYDFLGLPGSLEEQATDFLEKAEQNAQWAQDSIIFFLDFHKQRVRRKELAAGTLKNYYRAVRCLIGDLLRYCH